MSNLPDETNTKSAESTSPGGALSEVAGPYTADNGHSNGVAADDTRQAPCDDLVRRLRTAYPKFGEDLPMDMALLMEEAAARLEFIGRIIALQKSGELSVPGTLRAIEQELR